MRFWVIVRKLNVTDRQTDGRTDGQTGGGRCNISRPGPSAPREIIMGYCSISACTTGVWFDTCYSTLFFCNDFLEFCNYHWDFSTYIGDLLSSQCQLKRRIKSWNIKLRLHHNGWYIIPSGYTYISLTRGFIFIVIKDSTQVREL